MATCAPGQLCPWPGFPRRKYFRRYSMASADSETYTTPQEVIPQAVKVLVAGGFGTGKTTLVASVSEITPRSTEELMTEASYGVDDLEGVEEKATATVARDCGRRTSSDEVVLYLFAAPGQDGCWDMWDELAQGSLGAVVLADTRRLDTCFPAVDFFEGRGIPFVVAVNRFEGCTVYAEEEIREALD